MDANRRPDMSYRLPRHIKPKNYNIFLRYDITSKTFEGVVKITLDIYKKTRQITLHSDSLEIKRVFLDKGRVQVTTETSGDDRHFLYVNSDELPAQKNAVLEIHFSGIVSDLGLLAFETKTGRHIMASKFESVYARRAFPCFDEPDFKATFDVTLVKPLDYIALSNMNEISKKIDEKTQMEAVTFATSVLMSTYTLTFVILRDYGYVEDDIDTNGIGKTFKLRSFAQSQNMHKVNFAQDIGKKIIEYFIKYFEIPFPLPKLDMVAIPEYPSSAMEHWGLITYNEDLFLVDDATPIDTIRDVASVVAHEMCHMWFGNLVTEKWWNDLWLAESFARYLEYKPLFAVGDFWSTTEHFSIINQNWVFENDSKPCNQPIIDEVETPDEIERAFNFFVYNKGAAILHMLEGLIGEAEFRQGITDYLKKYQFGNAETEDLFSSLEPYFIKNNPGFDLIHIMNTWTRQKGYPLLTVEKHSEPNTYVITQKRYLQDPDEKVDQDSPFGFRWFIPVTYKTSKGSYYSIWMPDVYNNVEITLAEDEDLLKLNNDQVGLYRVNYSPEIWQRLISQLRSQSTQLTSLDRTQILNDVCAFAESGLVSYDLMLDFTLYLTAENELGPWLTVIPTLEKLQQRLINTEVANSYQKYIQSLIIPLYYKLIRKKGEPQGFANRYLFETILSLAIDFELPEAMMTVHSSFMSWLDGIDSPADPVALKMSQLKIDVKYKCGLIITTMAEWEHVLNIYIEELDIDRNNKLCKALSSPRDPLILKRCLELAWDEKDIKKNDSLFMISLIAKNPIGNSLVWEKVLSQWPDLVNRYTENNPYLRDLIRTITKKFNSEHQLKEMELFFEKYPEEGKHAYRALVLKTVDGNINWHRQNGPVIAWLKNQRL